MMQTVADAIAVATRTDPEEYIGITPRGAAAVALIRFERILPEIPAEDRTAALAGVIDELGHLADDEYIAAMLADLAPSCA